MSGVPHVPQRDSQKTFYLETFGCQMNVHDSEKVVGTLLQEGYRQVLEPLVPPLRATPVNVAMPPLMQEWWPLSGLFGPPVAW